MNTILETYLNKLTESMKPKILYHCSSKQNMKQLHSSYNLTNALTPVEKTSSNIKWTYAADTPKMASAFGFQWNDRMGIKFGSISNSPDKPDHKNYTLEIPKKHVHLIMKPCSMYTLDNSTFYIVPGNFKGEYRSQQKIINILSEKKFKSCKKCMEYYKVKVKVI